MISLITVACVLVLNQTGNENINYKLQVNTHKKYDTNELVLIKYEFENTTGDTVFISSYGDPDIITLTVNGKNISEKQSRKSNISESKDVIASELVLPGEKITHIIDFNHFLKMMEYKKYGFGKTKVFNSFMPIEPGVYKWEDNINVYSILDLKPILRKNTIYNNNLPNNQNLYCIEANKNNISIPFSTCKIQIQFIVEKTKNSEEQQIIQKVLNRYSMLNNEFDFKKRNSTYHDLLKDIINLGNKYPKSTFYKKGAFYFSKAPYIDDEFINFNVHEKLRLELFHNSNLINDTEMAIEVLQHHLSSYNGSSYQKKVVEELLSIHSLKNDYYLELISKFKDNNKK